MPDLHGWITQQINAVEETARRALDEFVYFDVADEHVAEHYQQAGSPAAVLRRCTADRKILAIHTPAGGTWDPYACDGCGIDSEYGHEVRHTNDCETLQALAEGYGLTVEQRAELDRPEPERPAPSGPSLLPDGLAEAMYGNLIATFIGTRPLAPSPKDKAIKILEPELKKTSGYVPIAEEQP